MLEIVDLSKTFPVRNAFGRTDRRGQGRRRRLLRHRARAGLRPGRRERLGQIDHRAHDHGADRCRPAATSCSTARTSPPAAARAPSPQGADGVPEPRLLAQSAPHRRPVDRRAARCPWPSARRPRHGRISELLEMVQLAGRFRRSATRTNLSGGPEAARRHCARAGRGAQAAGARRADLGARRLGAGRASSTCWSTSAAGSA